MTIEELAKLRADFLAAEEAENTAARAASEATIIANNLRTESTRLRDKLDKAFMEWRRGE